MKINWRYVLDRAKEPSSWRGLVWILTALGAHIDPDQALAIGTVGAAIAGAIGVFFPESSKAG